MDRLTTAIIIGGLFYLAGQYVVTIPERERQATEADRTITVTGQATISQRPDVATLTLGTRTEAAASAEAALSQLTTQFNQVVTAIEEAGVAEEDVATSNFSLEPQYDYRDGRQQLRGYVAAEQVIVTGRDLAAIGPLISRATGAGANQLGNVTFGLDDDSPVIQEAEAAAIADARAKAKHLASELGVGLGPVKSYQASSGGGPEPYYARAELLDAASASEAPRLPSGQTDTSLTVTITFELRS